MFPYRCFFVFENETNTFSYFVKKHAKLDITSYGTVYPDMLIHCALKRNDAGHMTFDNSNPKIKLEIKSSGFEVSVSAIFRLFT